MREIRLEYVHRGQSYLTASHSHLCFFLFSFFLISWRNGGNNGFLAGAPLLPRAWSRALIAFPFPFESLPRKIIIFQNLNMIQALFIRFLVEYLFRAQNVNGIENQAPGPEVHALVRLGNIIVAAVNYMYYCGDKLGLSRWNFLLHLVAGVGIELITITVLGVKKQRHFQTIGTLVGQINAWTKDLTLNISKIILCCSAGRFYSNQWGV